MSAAPVPMRVTQMLKRRAQAHASRLAFTFHGDDGSVTDSVTYGELESRTRAIAASLLSTRSSSSAGGAPSLLSPGDAVLLVFLPSLDFIVAFLACLRAKLIAVPTYPPDPRAMRVNTTLFASVVQSSGARVALSHKAYTSKVKAAALAARFGIGSGGGAWPELSWMSIEDMRTGSDATVPPGLDAAEPSDVAFLQYTSGSTSEPKGVIVTHSALSANLVTIVTSLKASEKTVVASWLPQYHDMGLVGSYLGVLFCGGSGYYMSPLSFMKSPLSWLTMVTKYKATHIQAPNFAYALVAKRYREAVGAAERSTRAPRPPALSLASIRHAFNAAEPITLAAVRDFSQTFAPFGFNLAAWAPGYGLAESTVYVSDRGTLILAVDRNALEGAKPRAAVISRSLIADLLTAPPPPAASETARIATLISCGPVNAPPGLSVSPFSSDSADTDPAASQEAQGGGASPSALSLRAPAMGRSASSLRLKNPDVWVVIVNTETLEPVLQEGLVGEVWTRSPSIAKGYFGAAAATKATFGGRLIVPPARFNVDAAGSTDAFTVDWLRTGDLGFTCDGELFICGRSKDLIIVRGRNFFPQDLEAAAVAAGGNSLRPGCAAAFMGGGDAANRLILVAEVRSGVAAAELPGLAAAIRDVLKGDFGLHASAVLLLSQGAARKTTSGKIARAFNRRAWEARDAGLPPAASPWHDQAKVVLFAWTDTTGGGGVVEDGGDGDDEGASSVGAAQYDPAKAAFEGDALRTSLLADIGVLLRVSPAEARALDTRVALHELGLDSLTLSGLAPRFRDEYALHIGDAQVFADTCTVDWIVENGGALRRGEVELPATLADAPAAGVAGARQTTTAPTRPTGRRQPSYCEQNFPCFLICCG